MRTPRAKPDDESGFAVIIDGKRVAVLKGITDAFSYGRGYADQGAQDVKVEDLSAKPEQAQARRDGRRIAKAWRYYRDRGFIPLKEDEQ